MFFSMNIGFRSLKPKKFVRFIGLIISKRMGKPFFFPGTGKSSWGGAAKGLPARAERPGRERGRGRAATGPRPRLA